MRHKLSGVLVAGILVTAGLRSPAAEASETRASGRMSIVVRTYTQGPSADEMRTASRTAGAILGRAGIHVAWLTCGMPAGVADRAAAGCSQPLGPNELLVRVVTAGTSDKRPHVDTLGFAFVDLAAGGGSLATLYADRVQVMAEGAGVDAAELLGRAMAHEVGHLLLGTNRHARDGLMRASWSSADLRRNRATQWLFGGEEGEVMRSRIREQLAFRDRATMTP